jgi:hypothetical protein
MAMRSSSSKSMSSAAMVARPSFSASSLGMAPSAPRASTAATRAGSP